MDVRGVTRHLGHLRATAWEAIGELATECHSNARKEGIERHPVYWEDRLRESTFKMKFQMDGDQKLPERIILEVCHSFSPSVHEKCRRISAC